MKYYDVLSRKPCFTTDDVISISSNYATAMSIISRLCKANYAVKIRKGLYACVNPATGISAATPFQVASCISQDSFCSHHTALSYWGLQNQVFSEIYVSSRIRFRPFEFEGYRYVCVLPTFKEDCGVLTPFTTPYVNVTDRERAVLDSIKDMDKIAGFEEVFSALQILPAFNEEKALQYLPLYGTQFMWQKTGFLFSKLKEAGFKLVSDEFLEICRNNVGKSKRYLSPHLECNAFSPEWNLYVPFTLDDKNGVN